MQREDWGTALQALGVLLVGEEITERDEVGTGCVSMAILVAGSEAVWVYSVSPSDTS